MQSWIKSSYYQCVRLPFTWTADTSECSGQDKVCVDFSVDVTNGTGSSMMAEALLSPNKAFRFPRTTWSRRALLCRFTESTVPRCAASFSFDDKNCCLISRIFLTTFSFVQAQFLHIISVRLLPLSTSFAATRVSKFTHACDLLELKKSLRQNPGLKRPQHPECKQFPSI